MRRIVRLFSCCLAACFATLATSASLAGAVSVTEIGEGFPLSVNESRHVLLAHLAVVEGEEELHGPWSIWASGSSTVLSPLNGGPETSESGFGEVEHSLFLYRLNAAGDAGGTSTISYFRNGEEHTVHRAAWYSPSGVGHEVPVLQEEVFNAEGEGKPAGAFGTGIDGAGDVSGIGIVQTGEALLARGFFSAGGTSRPSIVGGSAWVEIGSMNESGTMFGKVSEVNEKNEPVNPKYALWKGPGASATMLDFDEQVVGFPLANDGSAIGYRSGALYLRTPSGSETRVSGLDKPIAVNSSHAVIGSELVSGAEHAAIWRAGEVTDLNSLLPKGSGWVLQRATAIDDTGDIAGVGTHEGKLRAFLLEGEGGVRSSISGAPSIALPEEGTATEEFAVSLSEPSGETVTVDYETEDGTATVEHDDYTEESGTLTFAPGETSKAVKVQIDDGDGEDDEATETYTVRLTGTPTSTPQTGAATATGSVGLPGIAGKLVSGPASGAATPLAPAAGITLKVAGKSAGGAAVSQTVTSDAKGEYRASVDAGEYSVSPEGVPAGQKPEFTWSPSAKCPGKRKGPTCEKVPVKAANGTVVQSTVDFGYGQRDPQVENIEVIQGTQLKNYDKSGPEIVTPDGKMKSFEYGGVGLVEKSDTIVRVYVSNNGPGSAQEVAAQLRGYEAGSGGLAALPGGPLTPLNGMLDGLPSPTFDAQRGDAGATFNFRLPESWEKGKITLAAKVDPSESFPECSGCRDNDKLALTGVSFTEVPPFKYLPMSISWTEAKTKKTVSSSEPVAAVARTWPYWPLPTGGIQPQGTPVTVDLTASLATAKKQLAAKFPYYRTHPFGYNTESLVGCLNWEEGSNTKCVDRIEPLIWAAEKAALPAGGSKLPVVGVYNDKGFTYGVVGAADNIPGQFSYVPESTNYTQVIVHEIEHQLGFKHSGCTGPADEETWPVNSQGQASLVGFGENRSLNTDGGIGPILTTTGTKAGEGFHDIESYCFPLWPSTFNWDRTLQRLASETAPKPVSSYPAYSSLTASTAAAGSGGGYVTVSAFEEEGAPVIADVQSGVPAEVGRFSTPFTAQARNAHGHVIASVPIKATPTHGDVSRPGAKPNVVETMQFELPVKGLASIAIMDGKHLVSSIAAPKKKLKLNVTKLSRGVCRRRGPLTLHYRVNSAASFPSVRVYAVVGNRSKLIEIGARAKTILLPRGSRPAKAKALRISYSNGFTTATSTVRVPKGCRAG